MDQEDLFAWPQPDILFPGSDCQAKNLYQRLLRGPITNVGMRDELGFLSHTRRIFEVREALKSCHGAWRLSVEQVTLSGSLREYRLKKEMNV